MKAYAGMGACTRALGEHSTALSYYQQHLSIALKVADRAAIGKAYCSIGGCTFDISFRLEADVSASTLRVRIDRFR